MLLAATCAGCGRRGASPCPTCWAALRGPAPEPPPPGLDGLVVLLRYEGPARPLVARIKYRNQRQAVAWLGAALADRVRAWGPSVALVTWAPTLASHRAVRGFDHAELLAREVGRHLGVPTRSLLARRPGPAQTGRSAPVRQRDPPVFVAVDAPPAPGPVLVVDDVVTTGATLAAAVAALRAGGWEARPAAVARTPAPGGAARRVPMSPVLSGPRATSRVRSDHV